MTLGNFSEQAESYQRSRPTYPPELLGELVSIAGVSSGDAVVDFGAGTGILTRMLVDRGFRVAAIEPNEAMRNQASIPSATWIDASFESSTLADGSQRWAIAAQAFHWADPPRALPEIRRVLAPSCCFTILWNNRARSESEIVQWTEDSIRRHVPEFEEAYRDRAWAEILESTGDFTFVKKIQVQHAITMSQERFLDLWRSHNRLNTIAGRERFEAFYADLTSYLLEHRIEQVEVSYLCDAWTARRRD